MVISQPMRIILHIIIVLHQRCLNCSGLPETPYVLYGHYNIRVTHRNGAIKHIFYTNQIHGGIISRLFFIHFVKCSMRLLFIWQLNITSNLSVWGIWARCCQHLSVVFPSNANRTALFVTQPILLSENIPNIWHKSSTKHKEVQTRLKR